MGRTSTTISFLLAVTYITICTHCAAREAMIQSFLSPRKRYDNFNSNFNRIWLRSWICWCRCSSWKRRRRRKFQSPLAGWRNRTTCWTIATGRGWTCVDGSRPQTLDCWVSAEFQYRGLTNSCCATKSLMRCCDDADAWEQLPKYLEYCFLGQRLAAVQKEKQ